MLVHFQIFRLRSTQHWLSYSLNEKLKDLIKLSFSGDTNSITIEPLPDSDEDHIQEDLGKLTKADKARIGRVSLS